jgi:hypothetical protein
MFLQIESLPPQDNALKSKSKLSCISTAGVNDPEDEVKIS